MSLSRIKKDSVPRGQAARPHDRVIFPGPATEQSCPVCGTGQRRALIPREPACYRLSEEHSIQPDQEIRA